VPVGRARSRADRPSVKRSATEFAGASRTAVQDLREPNSSVAGVVLVSRHDEQALQELYRASYRRLVGAAYVVSGDVGEAEDAVQEAFVRLMGNWKRVSQYTDPEAWVRKVALGKVSNSRRKERNGRIAARRYGTAADQEPPSCAPVDVRRALMTMTRDHRAVLVLHSLGLDMSAIAAELGVPVGTAKSRLSRARALLAPLLREEGFDHA
jgi:RNA polymerase sigma factor (sigma-70 family)